MPIFGSCQREDSWKCEYAYVCFPADWQSLGSKKTNRNMNREGSVLEYQLRLVSQSHVCPRCSDLDVRRMVPSWQPALTAHVRLVCSSCMGGEGTMVHKKGSPTPSGDFRSLARPVWELCISSHCRRGKPRFARPRPTVRL